MKGYRDLRVIAALSLLCAILSLLIPLSGLALVFAAPLALLLPGYAIVAATFARRRLPWPQFLLLSIALSLATLVLGALLLNYLPGGIRAISWALLLLIVVFNGCRAAALRRRGRPAEARWSRPRLSRPELAMMLGGLALTVAALVLASATVPAKNAVGYTQLWVLPEAGSAGSEVQVGVKSEQQHPLAFDLRVRTGGGAPQVLKRSFELKPGEARVVRLAAAPGSGPGAVPVVATLLRHNRPYTVYRRVKGWLVAPKGR
jgi:hypothetical protein